MSQAREDNEPSMEEILASIRKIISDDEPDGTAADGAAAAAGDEDDILELTEAVEEDKGAKTEPSGGAPKQDTKVEPLPGAAPGPAKIERPEESMEAAKKQDTTLDTPADLGADMGADRSLSSTTESAVTSALAGFTGQISKDRQADSVPGGGMTLDTLVREAIEPQLKVWLDENLEKVVERVVRDEVRRLARRVEDN